MRQNKQEVRVHENIITTITEDKKGPLIHFQFLFFSTAGASAGCLVITHIRGYELQARWWCGYSSMDRPPADFILCVESIHVRS